MPSGVLNSWIPICATTLLIAGVCSGSENAPIDLGRAPPVEALQQVAWHSSLTGLLDEPIAAPTGNAEISTALDQARGQFRPATLDEVTAARRKAADALARLDTYLRGYRTGATWRKHLKLTELRGTLVPGKTPTVAQLIEVAARFGSGHRGLEMPQFRTAAAALDRYLALRRVAAEPTSEDAFRQRLDQVAANLEKALAGDVDALTALGDALGWLDERDAAGDLTAAVRRRFAQPNVVIQASAPLFAAGLTESVDTVEPVREQILGASVSGSGHTIGKLEIHPLADPTRALFDAEFHGVNRSRTVAAQLSARIASRGYTTLEAHKRLRFTPEGLVAECAKATACTDSSTVCVWSTAPRMRGRIVTRVARRRSAKSKSEAEQIAAERAAGKLEVRLDEQAGEQLAEANTQYWKNVRQPLASRGLFPRVDVLRTTESHIEVIGMSAGLRQLGAPVPPPPIEKSQDLVARVHESAINNLAFGLLAGETLKSEEVESKLGEAGVKVPPSEDVEEGEDAEDAAPRKGKWSITFADNGPIEVRFRDNGFRITIRGQRFTSQSNEFERERPYNSPMVVWADYRIEQTPAGPRAVRVDDIHALPPDIISGKRPHMSTPETALVNMLTRENRMGNVLRKEIGAEPFALPGRWKGAGELVLRELRSSDGCLAGSWQLVDKSNPAEPVRVTRASRE